MRNVYDKKARDPRILKNPTAESDLREYIWKRSIIVGFVMRIINKQIVPTESIWMQLLTMMSDGVLSTWPRLVAKDQDVSAAITSIFLCDGNKAGSTKKQH
jgi:hypothetical protein